MLGYRTGSKNYRWRVSTGVLDSGHEAKRDQNDVRRDRDSGLPGVQSDGRCDRTARQQKYADRLIANHGHASNHDKAFA